MVDSIPNRQQLSQYVVNREGWEGIRQTIYDFQSYAAAGQSVLTFFAQPVGQGTAVIGGGAKSISDTNMTLAGQLPTNQEFLVQSIEVQIIPQIAFTAAQLPAAFGAQAIAQIVNDVYKISSTGNLQFVIGSKPYLQEAPIGRFPPKTHFTVEGAAADVSTAGASFQTRIVYGYNTGRPYMLHPASLLLTSNQNFNVSLNWPEGVVAINAIAKIGVILDGILYRRSQ